jgi:hypothetical protein
VTHLSWQAGALLFCGLFLLWVVTFLILNEYDKRQSLPKPWKDERDWSINYMTDFKRWTER